MKKLCLFITLLAAMIMFSVTCFATDSVIDDAHLLKPEEQKQLELLLKDYEKEYGVRMAVVTKKAIGGYTPGDYANKLIDTVYNDGKNGNIVLLQVTSTRKWYISTDKKLKSVVVGKDGVEYISKPMVAQLKKGNYLGAYSKYAERSGKLLEYYREHQKGWEPENYDNIVFCVVAAVVAGIVAKKRRSSLIQAMSNVRSKTDADTYLDGESFQLTHSDDVFLYSRVAVAPNGGDDDDDDDGGMSDDSSDGGHGGGGGDY